MLSKENNVDEIQNKVLSQLDENEIIKAINVGINDLKIIQSEKKHGFKHEVKLIMLTIETLLDELKKRKSQ